MLKKEEVRQKRLEGLSIKAISEQTGVPKTTVRRWTLDIPIIAKHPLYLTDRIQNDYFSTTSIKKFPERLIFAGFIAADGCIYSPKKGQKKLCFNISKKDQQTLHLINEEICSSSRKVYSNPKTKSVSFYIPSNQICQDLRRYGIKERKTQFFRLPRIESKYMHYFLRGYFYGDGCFYSNGRMSMFLIVATKMFNLELKNYLIGNKILDTCAIHPIKNSEDYTQLHIKGRHQVTKMSEYLFQDSKHVLIPRKHITDLPFG